MRRRKQHELPFLLRYSRVPRGELLDPVVQDLLQLLRASRQPFNALGNRGVGRE